MCASLEEYNAQISQLRQEVRFAQSARGQTSTHPTSAEIPFCRRERAPLRSSAAPAEATRRLSCSVLLLVQMAEATSSAEAIRKDIGALSKRSLTLPKDTWRARSRACTACPMSFSSVPNPALVVYIMDCFGWC